MTDYIDYRDTKKDKVILNDSTTVPFSTNNSNFIDYREPLINKPNVISPTTDTNIPEVFNNQLQPESQVESLNNKEEEKADLTEDMLRKNPQWIKDAKTIYKERTGKPFFGTNKDAANWLLDDQSWMSWNFTSMGKRAFESGGWDANTSEAYLRTLNTYPESNITLRSALSAIGYSIADLPTLGSLGWSLVAKAVGGKTAQLAMRYSFKEQLKKRILAEAVKQKIAPEIAKEIANRSGKGLFKKNAKKQLTKLRREVAFKTGIKNLEIFAPLGAAYNGLFDLGTQSIRKDVDPNKDDIDYVDTAVAAGLGGIFGSTFGLIAPQVSGRFGRSKFFKESLAEDIMHGDRVPDNTTAIDLIDDNLEKQLVKTGDLPKAPEKIKGLKNNAIDLLKKIITPGEKVLSIGGGRYIPKIKGVAEKIDLEKTGAKVDVSELPSNAEKSNVPLNTYIKQEDIGKENYTTAIIQNVFGLIPKADDIVGQALISDAAKSITKDGQLIINVGPQIKVAAQRKKVKDPISIRDQRKGQIIEDKKRPVDFEETIESPEFVLDDPINSPNSPLDEQSRLLTEKITTSLGEDDLVRMLLNDFRDIARVTVKGERIYIAKKPIIYTPRTQPKPNSKTFFQKIGQLRKNYFEAGGGLPPEVANVFSSKKAIQRGTGKNVEAVWNKLERAIHNRWLNKSGAKYGNWTPKEREAGSKQLDAAMRGAFISETNIDARDSLPKFLRDSVDDMRETIREAQQIAINSGYIPEGTEFHTAFINSMGVRDKKGIIRAKEIDGNRIELHINRQYEVTNPGSDYLKNLMKTESGIQRVQAAREYYRKMLLSKAVAEDGNHPLQGKAIDVQRLKSLLDSKKLSQEARTTTLERYDNIMGGANSEVDAMVEEFLSKYNSKQVNEIAKLSNGLDDLFANKALGGGGQGVKATFYARKDLPPVLRDLMGEYRDPFINYGNTIMKLQQNIHNYAFEKEIASLVRQGKFPGVVAPQLDAFGNQVAPITAKGFKNLGDASQLARGLSKDMETGKLKPSTNLPLENMQAEDLMFDAVQMGNDIAPLINPGWQQFLKLQALTRISKTAYSLAAQPRNFLGAALKSIAAGNLNIPQFVHTVKVMRGIGKLNDDKLTAQLEKWASLDILGSGAKIGSLREALEETGEKTMLQNDFNLDKSGKYTTVKGLKYNVRRANNAILDVYQSMDDMWKVYSFLNERKRYKQVLRDKGTDPDKIIRQWRTVGGERVEITELDQYAAMMVGRHMDNYGETSRMVKYARRLPAADFLAYKTEQYRTVKNIFKTSFQDMKEGRALLNESKGKRGRAQLIQGFQRFGSIVSAIGIPMGIAGGAFYNPDEKKKVVTKIGGVKYILPLSREEAMREVALPDYAAGDHWMKIKKLKDGTYKYLNLTYWDPLGPFRQPIMSAFRASQGNRSLEESLEKAYKDVGSNLLGNFGPSMLLEGIKGMIMNTDQYGNKITKPGDTMPEALKKRVLAFISTFQPNVIKEANRILATTKTFGEGFVLPTGEAGSLTKKAGFPQGRSTAIKRAVGYPEMIVDPKTSLPLKAAPIKIRLKESQNIFKDKLTEFSSLTETEIIDYYKRAVDYEYKAMRDLTKLYVAAQATGMEVKDVWSALTADGNMPTNFKESDVIAFVRGQYIPKIKSIDKKLIGFMRQLYSKGQVKSKLSEVQKELNEIRMSYQGAPLFEPLKRETPERNYSPSNIIDFR